MRSVIVTTVAAVVLSVISTSATAAIIRLKADVQVTQPLVKLGDVADVRDNDAALVDRLKAVTLCPAPPPGQRTQLQFAEIRRRMQAQGLLFSDTQFEGKSLVTITSVRQVTPAAFIEEPRQLPLKPQPPTVTPQHRNRARQLLSGPVAQYLVRRDPALEHAEISFSIEDEHVPQILAGAASGYEISGGRAPWEVSQALTVRILSGDGTISELPIVCDVKHKEFILAAKYTLQRGHIVQASDVTWKPVNTATNGISRLEDIVGKETITTIRQDQPLTDRTVQAVPLIRTNDIVTVYSRSPGISVKRLFKARGTGVKGDAITLQTLDGRQRVLARVIGYHEAEVIGAGTPPVNERIRFQAAESTGNAAFRGRVPRRQVTQSTQPIRR